MSRRAWTVRAVSLALALLTTLILSGCGLFSSDESVRGTWTGYLGTGTWMINGDLTIVVQGGGVASFEGVIENNDPAEGPWGTFRLEVSGAVDVDGKWIAGPITMTRYRAGRDTLTTVGSMDGRFEPDKDRASGEWGGGDPAVFTVTGAWGAVR